MIGKLKPNNRLRKEFIIHTSIHDIIKIIIILIILDRILQCATASL